MIGKRFGKLKVIKKVGVDNNRFITWLCECDCGNKVVVRGSNLRTGNTKSCGCVRKENTKMLNFVTGMSNSRLHRIWSGMKSRCFNPNAKHYHRYGGRGITVCEEWRHQFKPFYDWAMSHGYTDELTIDRIDNDGNYCPENCRWVTVKEQSRNMSKNRFVNFRGETLCVADLAIKYNISSSVLLGRINRNWDIERALTTPVIRK